MENIKLEKFMKSESCPCGSGKRYKACCFNKKDKEIPYDKMFNSESFLNYYIQKRVEANKIKQCLHPNKSECKGKIKEAHSIQNNRILSKLSEEQHVAVLKAGVDINGIIADLSDKSKNKATTFTGFCDYHDTKLFREIEVKDFDPKSNEQKFLFGYRALALELHKKQEMLATFQNVFADRPSLTKVNEFIINYRLKQLALKDLKEYKEIFDGILLECKFSRINSYVIEFNYEIDFAICSGFNLEYDLEGKQMNNIYSTEDERIKMIFLNIFPANNKSYFIFSWLKEEDYFFVDFIEQLKSLGLNQFQNYINNLLPFYSENFVLSPRLWNKYDRRQKKELLNKFLSDFPNNPEEALFNNFKNNKRNLLVETNYNLFLK
ncbi:SEC-C metal-binding domain-containing protein [Priestia megaterium]|uniref:SEC-C metal-binding domain-containing protein n=1 Tax=Priestia megaterium TaxID=1404 RepID=UPI0015968D97|nr:SEC-C metal-binding domain-containing protein [Priestia megaterium]